MTSRIFAWYRRWEGRGERSASEHASEDPHGKSLLASAKGTLVQRTSAKRRTLGAPGRAIGRGLRAGERESAFAEQMTCSPRERRPINLGARDSGQGRNAHSFGCWFG